jgi:hypothetical protein
MEVDIVAPADHRPDSAVAIHRDQCALRASGRIGVDRAVGGRLHAGVERCPDVDRVAGSSISVSSCGRAQSVK